MSVNETDTLITQQLLQYPIGKFNAAQEINATILAQFVAEITALPTQLRQVVQNLNNTQLDTAYRPGGWTIRQVVHHIADSHLNSYTRFKLALTEEKPLIKPYAEERWAELADAKTEPVEVSLILIEALHHRWVVLCKSLSPNEWQRTFVHPESGETTLAKAAGIYAWHGRHHLAHIQNLLKLKNW